MEVLVTGGAGFIGSHITDFLLSKGNNITCIDNFNNYYNPELKRKNIKHNLGKTNFKLIEGDIRDRDLIKNILQEKFDYVFHLAAQPGVRASIKNPILVNDINVNGTINILNEAMNSSVKKVIFASSSSVYGDVKTFPIKEDHPLNPISPYGASKICGERYCKIFEDVYGLKTVSLRYFTVYGPRMRPDLAINIFTKSTLNNEPISVFGDGLQTRDFTFVKDVVDATILSMKNGKGEYNIGGGNRLPLIDLINKIKELTNSESKIIYKDAQKGDMKHTWADNNKARKELDWNPKTKVDEGLKLYVDWVKLNL